MNKVRRGVRERSDKSVNTYETSRRREREIRRRIKD